MLGMGELLKKYQVAFWSTPEVRKVLDALVSEAKNDLRLTFRGENLKQQVVLNALILHVGALPDPIRQEALAAGIARLEALLTDVETADPAADPPQTVNAHDEDAPPPPSPRRKTRG
jgi:hypothetical protein